MTLLFNHEKAVLRYNRETNAFELIWKKQADEASYKMLFLKGLEAFKETGATAWLSDIRNEGIISPDLSNWLQENIFPKAIENGLKKIAVVMDSDIFKEFYADSIKKHTKGDMMRYFHSVEAANEWLKDGVLV